MIHNPCINEVCIIVSSTYIHCLVLCINVLFVIVVPEERVEKHCIKVSSHTKKRAIRMTCVLSGIRPSYDSKFKLMMISYTKTINNCNAARKFSVTKANVQRWKKQKQKLTNANSIQKSFSDPSTWMFPRSKKTGYFWVCAPEEKKWSADYLHSNKVYSMETCQITHHHFKSSTDCVCI